MHTVSPFSSRRHARKPARPRAWRRLLGVAIFIGGCLLSLQALVDTSRPAAGQAPAPAKIIEK